MTASLTPTQLTTLVVAFAAALSVILPVIAGVAILGIQQYGRIREAMGKVNAVNGTIESHTQALLQVNRDVAAGAAQTAVNTTEIAHIVNSNGPK